MKQFQSRPRRVFTFQRSRKPAAAARFPAETRLAGLQAVLNAAAPAQRLRTAQRMANGRGAPAQRMDDEEELLQGTAVQRMDDEEELLQGMAIQRMDDEEELLQGKAIQRMDDEEELLQGMAVQRRAAPYARPARAPLQRNGGGGGLPDDLRAGIESLSGMSMDGVRVHRNSAAPARVGAHAYAQGTDIHLAPGQDRHLPHEAWHVVQQAQGRVRPTMDVAGTPVNDDAGLEAEADRMGAAALQRARFPSPTPDGRATAERIGTVTGRLRTGLSNGALAAAQLAVESAGTGKIGARSDPFGDVEYTIMPASNYAALRETAQFTRQPHGSAALGSQVVVSRYRSPASVMQMVDTLTKVKAGLIITEGVLTLAAGTAAAVLSGGIAVVPAIIGACVGAVKIARGILMLRDGTSPAVIDAMRGLEAVGSLVGGALAGNPALIVFGIAKLIRSLVQAIVDWMGEDTEYLTVRKALMGLAAFAHATEVFALTIAGSLNIAEGGASMIAGGLATLGVAGGKAIRTGIQAGETSDAPTGMPEGFMEDVSEGLRLYSEQTGQGGYGTL